MKWIKAVWKDIAEETICFIRQGDFIKKWLFVFGVYFIGFLSILQANYLYKTDVSRVVNAPYGRANWSHSGRFLNDIFTYIFSFDS